MARTEPTSADEPGRPSRSVTALLLLCAAVLWLAVLAEMCVFVPGHARLIALFGIKLPRLSDQVFVLSRWFTSYWWAALLVGAIAVMPVLALVTRWVRHRQSSCLLRWLWGAVLLLPPLVLFGLARWAAFAPDSAVVALVEKRSDRIEEYLSPGGSLNARLTVRESRMAHGLGQTLVIEPTGQWQLTDWSPTGQVLRRQGQLTPAQLNALARHLAAQRLLELPPDLGQPSDQGSSVRIEFGPTNPVYYGVTRQTLRQASPPEDPAQAEEWSRFVGLLLVIEDFVGPAGPE